MIERDGKRTREMVEEGDVNSKKAVKKTVNRPQLNSRSRCKKLLFFWMRDRGRCQHPVRQRQTDKTSSLKMPSQPQSTREAVENNGILREEIRTSECDTHMFIIRTAV
jgi:hypothetical protein